MSASARYRSPCFTPRSDARSLCDALSLLDTRPGSPQPRYRTGSQLKTERRHPHSPTPSPRRSRRIPTSGKQTPTRAKEILSRMAALSAEMKRLELELRTLPESDTLKEGLKAKLPPLVLDSCIHAVETNDSVETPKVKWTAQKRPSVLKA